MHISSNPTMDQVSHLLSQCGLPSDDILPEYLPNFVLARDDESDVGVAGLQVLGSTALVRSGDLKGIIGLPANHFYGTGIPACIVVLDKENAAGRKGVFMIDASKGFIKDGPKNRLRELYPTGFAQHRFCADQIRG